jgi:predicted DCC family thiol-disulfide oxidoreductase YuxK
VKQPEFPVRIFYDGACIVCATEIREYQRQDRDGRLVAMDISAPDFRPDEFQIPLPEFMYELHVIDRNGNIYRGVEAFWAIWQAFPASPLYRLMGALVTAPVLNRVARLLYTGFARIRPFLPKRHDCENGTCSIRKKPPRR